MFVAIELVYGIWVVPDVVLLGGVSTMLSETRTLHYKPKHAILLFQIYAWLPYETVIVAQCSYSLN